MKIGVFAGSFCPVTLGHVDAIEHASKLVDKLFVVMGINASKNYVIPKESRLDMLTRSLQHISNVTVVATDGMLTDFCQEIGATVMIKSIRNALDLQQVIDLADINENYWDGETVFVVGSKEYRHVSSSLVRELAGLGKDFSAYVPACCVEETTKFLVR